jgi:hypothetical protein
VIDTKGFRFGGVQDIRGVDFLPGGAKYGDLPGMIALGSPGRLLLAGEGEGGMIRTFYRAAAAEDELSILDAESADWADSVTEWILQVQKR